ncbi:hypothetical protein D5018_02865 [Parashewanella curva]|uniref:Uncharacterized protein n=1 Tax=Parashewanella curva TaxID=2338552 RepID=A0A3L8Q0U7_9GAMM|nr:hypothetical protein [Parashewanella curva]RLV61215.1 hypothetical protein D5018_02865 [Parashewanella curva]
MSGESPLISRGGGAQHYSSVQQHDAMDDAYQIIDPNKQNKLSSAKRVGLVVTGTIFVAGGAVAAVGAPAVTFVATQIFGQNATNDTVKNFIEGSGNSLPPEYNGPQWSNEGVKSVGIGTAEATVGVASIIAGTAMIIKGWNG